MHDTRSKVLILAGQTTVNSVVVENLRSQCDVVEIATIDQAIEALRNDHFDARTFGLYATWLADDGFYLDASQRWIGIA